VVQVEEVGRGEIRKERKGGENGRKEKKIHEKG
jgi:hypothetical protein